MLDSIAARSTAIAAAGLGVVVVTWTHYLVAIARETVARRPVWHNAAMAAGALAGIAGVAAPLAAGGGPSIGTYVMLGVNLFLAGLYFWLLAQAAQPEGALVVSVGDALPRFESTDDTGAAFDSSELAGKRILLKFFRGHW